uniref:E3 ubiquitin/ISG15 ligase TRIM25-like n=1 Tax=Neogobius melanostomus TaxID=47308 RepID=A0A8C6UVM8_9GOBI
MALSVPLLSEDQLLCPICLGVFVEPVSTPCGHNFCMSCLSSYWDSSAPVCFCPVCNESFSVRPQLRVNTFISGLSQSFSSLQLRQEPQTSVLCDVCTAPQQDALMSCVECLSSFCSDHLDPHHRVPGLRRHTLIPPDTSLQDRVCPQHHQLLHSYCTEEGALLCAGCEGAHSKHKTLPLEQAHKKLRDQLEPDEAKITSLIQEKVQRVCSIRETKAQRHEETRRVITQSEKVLQDVLKKVQKSHKDLVQKMEEKQQQADSEADALVEQTEQEIARLIETQTKLQELKQTEDPLIFLKKHPNLSLVSLNSLSTLNVRDNEGLKEMSKSLESCISLIKEFLEKLDRELFSLKNNLC